MLASLAPIKLLLGLTDTQSDDLLTELLCAVSARFDKECRRSLGRCENLTQEFAADQTEIVATCYPIEKVGRFELKTSEAEGWLEQTGVSFLVRRNCVISLGSELGDSSQQARVIYTGGYVLPDATAAAGQTALPEDLQSAAVRQTAYWFQNRDSLGVAREWPKGGLYKQFQDLDLLPDVRATLRLYQRQIW